MGALVQIGALSPARAAAGPLESRRFSRVGAVMAAGLLLGFAAVFFAPRAAGPILAVAGLLAFVGQRPFKAPSLSAALLLALGFLAYCSATLLLGGAGEAMWLRFAGVLFVALGAYAFVQGGGLGRNADQVLARRAAWAGGAAVLSLLCLDIGLAHDVSRALLPKGPDPDVLGRGRDLAAMSVLLSCGLSAVLLRQGWRGWLAVGGLIVGNLALCWVYWSGVALAALIGGVIIGVIGWLRPEFTLIASGQAGALWLVAAPWVQAPLGAAITGWLRPHLGQEHLFDWVNRLRSWRYTAEWIAEKPALGHGFDAARLFSEARDLSGYVQPLIVHHPHAMPLQIWLELGAVGAALAAGVLATFGRRLGAEFGRNRPAAASVCALFSAGLLCGALDVGLWDGWFWASLAIGASMIALSQAAE